nr:CheR family methyltransferase [Ameyamaea chiangmaiensis]
MAIAAIVRNETGISLKPTRSSFVYSRLSRRLRTLGLESFAAYCELLIQDGQSAERRALVSALTTNVTAFFRERHHFAYLRQRLIHTLAPRVHAGGRVRLWSTACSSGEEAYSMALTVLSVLPDATRYDIRILATDIDVEMLETARLGLYTRASVREHCRDTASLHWETGTDDRLQVPEAARSLVEFLPLNLIGAWPPLGTFDIIFCRNVAIYFDFPTQTALWRRLCDHLPERGLLSIGHSERIPSENIPGLHLCGITTYQWHPS